MPYAFAPCLLPYAIDIFAFTMRAPACQRAILFASFHISDAADDAAITLIIRMPCLYADASLRRHYAATCRRLMMLCRYVSIAIFFFFRCQRHFHITLRQALFDTPPFLSPLP